jgi:hypothetical protein
VATIQAVDDVLDVGTIGAVALADYTVGVETKTITVTGVDGEDAEEFEKPVEHCSAPFYG